MPITLVVTKRGTKVNGSHHGESPITVLLKPARIQIATNPCQVQPTEDIGNLLASRWCLYWYELQFLLVPLSLRNLVLRYECGRVFPADVGTGSPSRDAANWLPSRFSLSAETRRQCGWLRIMFPGAHLFQAPIWCPSGGVATRETQGALPRRAC